MFQNAVINARDFVTEDDGDGFGPVEAGHGNGIVRDFDRDSFNTLISELAKTICGAFVVSPGNVLKGAKSGFFKLFVGRVCGHAAEMDMFDGTSIRCAED